MAPRTLEELTEEEKERLRAIDERLAELQAEQKKQQRLSEIDARLAELRSSQEQPATPFTPEQEAILDEIGGTREEKVAAGAEILGERVGTAGSIALQAILGAGGNVRSLIERFKGSEEARQTLATTEAIQQGLGASAEGDLGTIPLPGGVSLDVSGTLSGALQSFVTSAAAAPAGVAGILTLFGAQAANNADKKFEDRNKERIAEGLEPLPESSRLGFIAANIITEVGPELFFNKIGLPGLEKILTGGFKASKSVAKTVARGIAGEVIPEVVTTLGQTAADIGFEVDPDALENLPQALVDTIAQAAIPGGVGGLSVGLQFAKPTRRSVEAVVGAPLPEGLRKQEEREKAVEEAQRSFEDDLVAQAAEIAPEPAPEPLVKPPEPIPEPSEAILEAPEVSEVQKEALEPEAVPPDVSEAVEEAVEVAAPDKEQESEAQRQNRVADEAAGQKHTSQETDESVDEVVKFAVDRGRPDPESPPVAVKNESTDRIREMIGADEINSRRTMSQADLLREAIDTKQDERSLGIAQQIIAEPRQLTDLETAGFAVRMSKLVVEYNDAVGVMDQAIDDADITSAAAQMNRIEDELDIITQASRFAGTLESAAFRARKLTIDNNLDLLHVVARAKANKGTNLTKEERADLKETTDKLDAANKRNDELLKQLEEKDAAVNAQTYLNAKKKSVLKMTTQERDVQRNALVAKLKQLKECG